MQPREALFLSLKVTNCSGERSFSRFKRIKNESNGRCVPGEIFREYCFPNFSKSWWI